MRWAVVALVAAGCLDTPHPGSTPGGSGGHILAAYLKHACAIDDHGQLYCWGNNASGELGMSQPAMTGTPLGPFGVGWTDIAAGNSHTCAVLAGVLKCFGDNSLGQAPADTQATIPLPGDGHAVRVFAGANAACAIDDIAALYCWGQVPGVGANMPPTALLVGQAIREVAIAYDHMCAIDTNNALSCWGIDDAGQLGDGGGTMRKIDRAFQFGDSYTHVAVHESATCALTLSGALQCWGATYANFGAADTSNAYQDLAMSSRHVCAIDSAGALYCYGDDDDGALGRGEFAAKGGPPTTSVAQNVTDLAVGEGFTCIADANNDVRCWGSNVYGELGNGVIATAQAPSIVSFTGETSAPTKVIAGEYHNCALFADHHVYCWGGNVSGEVMSGMPVAVPQPTLVKNNDDMISAGAHHSCAHVMGGSLFECWGDITPSTATIGNATMLASGGDAACVLASSEVICWGTLAQVGPLTSPIAQVNLSSGQFSLGGNELAYVVPNSTNIQTWAFGNQNDCVFASNGVGPPGINLLSSAATVAQVAVAQGGAHACVLYGDNVNLLCWGTQGAACMSSGSPESTGTTEMWASVSGFGDPQVLATGGDHSCAIGSLGDLFCWGDNTLFPYGAATIGSPDLPTQVNAMQWSQITTGVEHTCGVSGGQIYCWGLDKYGEVGNGQSFTNQRPANPIQFP